MDIQKIIRFSLAILFVGFLVGVYMYDHTDSSTEKSDKKTNAEESLQRYGFYLTEISDSIGVDFIHKAPRLDSRLDHIMPQVASMGASVSITDFNNDDHPDFYLTSSKRGTANALYQNMPDGSFRDVADSLGVADLNTKTKGASMGSVWGDFNNDNYEDLFVYRWGKPSLFRNDGKAGFTEVTDKSDFPNWVNANAAIWFDYNLDGYLDLFLAGYYVESIDLWNLESSKIMPESFEYATNGGRKYLFRNNGDGTFTEVSTQLGLKSNRWTLAASSADLTGNGYPDLIIANDYGVDQLFINEQGNRFREAGQSAGMGFAPKSGMNVSYGDVMNRGRLGVYVTNISQPGFLIQGNNFWVPASKKDEELSFQNLAGNFGLELGGWSYGAQFGDLNNDGNLDLYVANGYVSAKKGSDYWYDFSSVAGGNRVIINDAKNWPPMKGRSLSGYQENRIWLNDGAGRFSEVASSVGGTLSLDSRAVAYADLWNRGVLDIIVASQNGPVKVYKNNVRDSNKWIAFELTGTQSNTSAIGAEVELLWNDKTQLQLVSGGSGFSAQNQRAVYFGLGPKAEIEKAIIRWPSGMQQTLDTLQAGQVYQITEPSR